MDAQLSIGHRLVELRARRQAHRQRFWRYGCRTCGRLFVASVVYMLVWVLPTSTLLALDSELTGYAESELRLFANDPADPAQHGSAGLSFAFEPEWYVEGEQGDWSFTFTPFLRFDAQDGERTHFDVREAAVQYVGEDWELKVGISKVFWGVIESRHLVDVINQTDLVEDLDFDEKLGQPMVQLTLVRDWGEFSFFVLPGFRERTFPGEEGRLRSLPRVATENPLYESGAGDEHVDFATRWSHYFGDFDVGLSYFYGTSRDLVFTPALAEGQLVLRPTYNLIHQLGLDLQWTHDAWLWKLEALARSGRGQHTRAASLGVEYTLYQLFESDADLGLLAEYHTQSQETGSPITFEHDLFLGARLALNDEDDTDFLGGPIIDTESGAASARFESSTRLNDHWTVALEGQLFSQPPREDNFYSFRSDDFLRLQLRRYF